MSISDIRNLGSSKAISLASGASALLSHMQDRGKSQYEKRVYKSTRRISEGSALSTATETPLTPSDRVQAPDDGSSPRKVSSQNQVLPITDLEEDPATISHSPAAAANKPFPAARKQSVEVGRERGVFPNDRRSSRPVADIGHASPDSEETIDESISVVAREATPNNGASSSSFGGQSAARHLEKIIQNRFQHIDDVVDGHEDRFDHIEDHLDDAVETIMREIHALKSQLERTTHHDGDRTADSLETVINVAMIEKAAQCDKLEVKSELWGSLETPEEKEKIATDFQARIREIAHDSDALATVLCQHLLRELDTKEENTDGCTVLPGPKDFEV
jgi:hypothetical protein